MPKVGCIHPMVASAMTAVRALGCSGSLRDFRANKVMAARVVVPKILQMQNCELREIHSAKSTASVRFTLLSGGE